MFKKYLISILILFSFNLTADDDSISRFVYEYLKRINEFIDEQDYENAERELEIFARRYFLNEQSYERALINQLYGNYYAIQGDYTNAITWYEKSLKFRKMPFITGLQVRKNLAQCYFQSANYQETIRVLEEYIAIAKKRGQLYAPIDLIMLGISYYQNMNTKNDQLKLEEINKSFINNDFEDIENLIKYINLLETNDITQPHLSLLIKSINYNIGENNFVNDQEIKILINFYNGKYTTKFNDISSDIIHDFYISSISKLFYGIGDCENAKLYSSKIKYFNSIKDDTDNFINSCQGE